MFDNLLQMWRGLGPGARVALIAGALAVAIGASSALWVITREPYEVLFSELDPHDEAAIVSELDKLKMPYQIGDDGRTLLVERSQVHRTRLKVMDKGIDLKGTVGFEIFNNADFGMTEFAQKINYQRALQGELARTIMSIGEIANARVHLVLPDSSPFHRSAVRPKASVTVALKGWRPLSPDQIRGIQRLVAASVAEVDPDMVTVTDQQGVTLSRVMSADPDAELSGGKLEMKKQTEQYLTKKVVDVLDRAIGPGQAIVSVDVTLGWDQIKVTREDVLPVSQKDGLMAGALVKRREVAGYPGVEAVGETKVVGGVPPPPPVMSSAPMTSEAEYEHGKKLEQIVSTPGTIKRLSVGVMLRGPIEAARVQKISDIVAMVVGLNAARGDAIAVYALPSAPAAAAADAPLAAPAPQPGEAAAATIAAAAAMPAGSSTPPARWAGWVIVVGAAALVLVVISVLMRGRRGRLRPEDREATLQQVREWLRQDAAHGSVTTTGPA